MKKEYVTEKLSNIGNCLYYNEFVARAFDPVTAIVFAKLADEADNSDGEQFQITQEKIAKETSLSEFQVRKSIQKLLDSRAISVEKKGTPCRNFYTINTAQMTHIIARNMPVTTEISALAITEE